MGLLLRRKPSILCIMVVYYCLQKDRAVLPLLFTPVSITLLIDTEDACFDLNASRPIAKGDLKWRDALLVAHRVNSNVLSEEWDGV